MAKIIIAGDATVIKSTLKLEDIALVQKSRPKALTVYDEEDGKKIPESAFSIGVTAGKGSVTGFGICFNSASHDQGLAQVTVPVPAGEGDLKERVAEAYGVAVTKLARLEAKLPEIISCIKADNAAMLGSIEMM